MALSLAGLKDGDPRTWPSWDRWVRLEWATQGAAFSPGLFWSLDRGPCSADLTYRASWWQPGTGSTWAGSPVETQRKCGLLLMLYGSADLSMETSSVQRPPCLWDAHPLCGVLYISLLMCPNLVSTASPTIYFPVLVPPPRKPCDPCPLTLVLSSDTALGWIEAEGLHRTPLSLP